MEQKIRVITLYQPYATLLAYGIKKNETRPKPTTHTFEKGFYLIHAAKKWTIEQKRKCLEQDFYYPLKEICKDWHQEDFEDDVFPKLPLGQIIGSFEVKETLKVKTEVAFKVYAENINPSDFFNPRIVIKTPELYYGNYSVGRSVWIGQNHRVLKNPIPYKGQQGYYSEFKGNINQLKFKK